MPPQKERQSRTGGRSRAASVEGRDQGRAKELERERDARDAGRLPSPRAEIASLHRRVGRCILLLARFIDRGKEDDTKGITGEVGVACRLRCLFVSWLGTWLSGPRFVFSIPPSLVSFPSVMYLSFLTFSSSFCGLLPSFVAFFVFVFLPECSCLVTTTGWTTYRLKLLANQSKSIELVFADLSSSLCLCKT